MTRKIFWKKSLDQLEPEDFRGMKLRRVLGVMGLLLMGIRVIIGQEFYYQVLRLQTTLELL